MSEEEPHLAGHLDWLRLRNQRPRSIRERRYAVLRAGRWLGHPVADVTRVQLQAWQLDVASRVTPAGLHNETVHVAQFLRWLVLAGLRDADPTAVLVRPQLPGRLPRPLGDADVARGMACAGQPERAWIALAAFCGLRCLEIAGLAREDVMDSLAVPFLRITGKGGKERVVPLPGAVLAELEDAGMPHRGHLWTRMDGRPGAPSPVRVSERINRVLRDAGVPGTAHQLRHRYGTRLYEACRDPFLVAEAMGHASTQTTRGYVQLNPSAAAAAAERITHLHVLEAS